MMNWIKYVCLIIVCFLVCFSADVRAEENKAQAETTVVVATGIGIEPDSALKNALSNAIQQAIGTVVDAETLVQNEQIIKDQVLTYSDGFVSKVENKNVIKRGDGLFECSIKATVQKRKLIQKLKEHKISSIPVDGTSLFAETATQIKGEAEAKQLLKKALDGFPNGLINLNVIDQKPQIIENTKDGAKVSWKIAVSYNQNDYYNKVLPSLQTVFEQISVDKLRNYKSTIARNKC